MSIESYDRMVARMRKRDPSVVPPPYEESGFGVDCSNLPDLARQEFKAEADLSYQVRRFGAGVPFQVGQYDANMDLLKAHELVERTREAWFALPEKVRDRWKTWPELERAALSGELSAFLKPPAAPGGGSPGGAGGSPSDSAGGGAA